MLRDLITSRFLIWDLISRDIRSRYTGSLLGLFWSVINPILQLVLYTLIFSQFLGLKLGPRAGSGSFAAYLFCALLPWTAIHECSTRSATCFLEHSNLVKKVRFPLESLPFSIVCSALFHQALATAVFLIIMAFSGSLNLPTLPLLLPLLLVQAILMFGVALAISTLNVYLRDVAHLLGVGFQFLFWLTPIVYPRDVVPDAFQILLSLNPLTPMVEAFRYAVFGTPAPELLGMVSWVVVSIVALVLGARLISRGKSGILDMV